MSANRKITPPLVCALLFLGAFVLPAAAADGARARLNAFSRDLHSVSARFTQTVFDANGRRGDTTEGHLSLRQPRQFRWETLRPYKQSIVADGERVWIYDPDLEQVTVRAQGLEETHSPLTVLTDLSQLDQDFKVSEQGEHDGLAWLRLKSTGKNPQFDYADLGFDASPRLREMVFQDTLGNRTRIRFSDWQRNPKLSDSTFTFTPPKGADVMGDARPAAEVHPLQQ